MSADGPHHGPRGGDGPPKNGRLTCPACGRKLSVPPELRAEDAPRVRCAGCGGRYRLRRREGRSGELTPSTSTIGPSPGAEPVADGPSAAAPPVEPPAISGLDLAARGVALAALRWAYHLGNAAGVGLLLPLGGFVPVLRRRREGGPRGWGGVVEALGGVRPGAESADPDADFGPVLARADAPGLFDEVAEVARRLGARPPGQVRLAFLPCCGVVAWGRSRALLLGLPLLHVLGAGELRAVLAHELAHLARGDATAAARSSRFVEGLGQALDGGSTGRGPLGLWARSCRRLGDRLHAPIARGQEARADRAAAALAGGASAAGALVKVALVQPLFREVLDHYDPSRPDLPNLYAFFRDFWTRLPDDLQTSLRHRLLADRRAPIDPAHPALIERLALVQSYPDRPGPDAVRPAWTLVGDLESIEQMLHDRLFATGTVEPSLFHRAGT